MSAIVSSIVCLLGSYKYKYLEIPQDRRDCQAWTDSHTERLMRAHQLEQFLAIEAAAIEQRYGDRLQGVAVGRELLAGAVEGSRQQLIDFTLDAGRHLLAHRAVAIAAPLARIPPWKRREAD